MSNCPLTRYAANRFLTKMLHYFLIPDASQIVQGFRIEYSTATSVDQQLTAVNKVNEISMGILQPTRERM